MSQWLESPLTITAIVGTLGLLIAVVGVVWKLGQWTGGVDEHRKTMEDHRTTVAEFMKEIRDDFRDVRDDIKKLFRDLPKTTVESKRPTRLSDLGEKVATELKAAEWAHQLAATLEAEVAGMQPFEVDTFAFDFVYCELTERDADMSTRASKCADEFGISRDNVLAVLQVVRRDELISTLGLDEEA